MVVALSAAAVWVAPAVSVTAGFPAIFVVVAAAQAIAAA